ncbi:unnamed protein product, partial [Staurois parvus]
GSAGSGGHFVRLLFLNGRAVALQGRVAVHKRHQLFLVVCAPWERAALRTGARCVLRTIDWPISDHMQRSKQDVTCDIIAYYV